MYIAMSYEEMYKDVLDKAKEEYKNTDVNNELLEYLFPELKELKDEKIRKALIAEFSHYNVNSVWAGIKIKDIIMCLEKQREQKPAEEYNITGIGSKNAQGKLGEMIKNLKPFNEVLEQKSADKVEPKFKVGDWAVSEHDRNTRYVSKVHHDKYNNYYLIKSDVELEYDINEYDRIHHLWTIQDAKDGDVLASESECGLGTWCCIFKSLEDEESMTVHCYLSRDGRVEAKPELCFDKDPFGVHPATKEQRDLLFQKMREAGYEWNATKLELKKIEQKPAWSEEGEKYMKGECGMAQYINKDAVIAEIERRKQTWQHQDQQYTNGGKDVCDYLLGFLETLEVKEVDLNAVST